MLEIEKLCKKIGKDLAVVQKSGRIASQWPFIISELEPFFAEEFSCCLKDSLALGYLSNHYPSALSQYITLIHTVKHLDLEDRKTIVNKIIELQKLKRKDHLCVNNNQLQNFEISKYLLQKGSENKKIKLTSSLLFSFYERIYPTLMRLGYEFHGPYIFNNKKYIVKEYYDMQEYYNQEIPTFPFKNLKIIEEFVGNFIIDYFGHVHGEYNIKNAYLFVDDVSTNDEKITEIYNITQQNYLKLLANQKDYSVSDYAINLTKGLFWTLDKKGRKYSPSPELLEKLKDFKPYFSREKLSKTINEKSFIELEKSIADSFIKIFQ
ncbi:MAG TPA: hypothetical protein P5530_03295 [Candidatus Diapherotrites archaeon]|jgi:hypothetical protein|nr:hypothetical protein [Candidatus Diapherotrites archaeon]